MQGNETNALYSPDGKWVAPDIYIETNFKYRLEGKDPQLKRAIEEIKKEWKK